MSLVHVQRRVDIPKCIARTETEVSRLNTPLDRILSQTIKSIDAERKVMELKLKREYQKISRRMQKFAKDVESVVRRAGVKDRLSQRSTERPIPSFGLFTAEGEDEERVDHVG
jgi:hypothetical protein